MKLRIRTVSVEKQFIEKYVELVDDDDFAIAEAIVSDEYNETTDCSTIKEENYNRDNESFEENYSLERLYLEGMGYSDDMTIILWPDSQDYMEEKWFKKEAHLINDDFGLKHFGGSAYIVPLTKIK